MSDTVDTLKQRVVGAFVIISLAVIFLPMIFDEPRVTQSNVIVPVPPRPAYKVIEIEKPLEPKFQELVVDPESNKVVTKLDEVTAAPANLNQGSGEQTAQANAEPSQPVSVEVKAPSSSVKNTPSVSHLPVFKNVWMIQLGVFSDTQNAYNLRDSLRKDGFDGHTKQIELDGKPAIRVFTGPFVDKREAEKIKLQVDKKYKLKSQVIFFDA